jgi:hypothetical protein
MANDELKAIATKYEVAVDQISAILSALSIKTENPNEVQLKGFERVCELMKGGTPLEKAAQVVADDAKAKTTVPVPPRPFPGSAQEAAAKVEVNGHDDDEAGLVVAETQELLVKKEKALRSFPPDIRSVLEKFIREQAQKMVDQMPSKAGGQVKRSVVRFEAQLWDELGETCDSLLQVNIYQMMSTPEFVQKMEAALSDPQE